MAADGDDEQASLVRLAQELTGIVPRLQKLAARGALPAAARGTAWRLFLRVVPPQHPDRWAAAVAGKRATYETLRAAAHAALHEAMAQALDDQNGGAEHGDDGDDAGAALEEAADQIRRDCERCYLEGAGDHFLEPARQQLMFGVLLTWAHAHPEPGYRQGMHEVLAPLVLALEESGDAAALVVLPPENALHALLDDAKYLEADVYALFDALMADVAPLYATGGSSATPVLALCERVQGAALRAADPELAAHLNARGGKTDVLPQVYMLPWLRLLFGRQFPVGSVLVLWDAFFSTARDGRAGAAASHPTLAQWLEAVATLLLVLDREALLACDAAGCLRRLLRYEAREPTFVALVARRLVDSDGALDPLIASLRQHAALATVFPDWFVSVLSSLGVVRAKPEAAAGDEPSYAASALRLGQTALCMAYDPSDDAVLEGHPRAPPPPPPAKTAA